MEAEVCFCPPKEVCHAMDVLAVAPNIILGALSFVPTVLTYEKGSLFSLCARFDGRVGMKSFMR